MDNIIYSLDVQDLQQVANDEIGRELDSDEIQIIIDSIGDYIPWYDLLSNAIQEKIK